MKRAEMSCVNPIYIAIPRLLRVELVYARNKNYHRNRIFFKGIPILFLVVKIFYLKPTEIFTLKTSRNFMFYVNAHAL